MGGLNGVEPTLQRLLSARMPSADRTGTGSTEDIIRALFSRFHPDEQPCKFVLLSRIQPLPLQQFQGGPEAICRVGMLERMQAKIQTLNDFLREEASLEETRSFAASLYDNSTDHVSLALRGCALVERSLTDAILARLWTNNGKAESELTGLDEPLSTFSHEIRMGEAIRVYGPETRKNLDLIKKVRNAFAHTHRQLSFDLPPITSICNNLTLKIWPYTPRMPIVRDARDRYALCCAGLYMVLRARAKQTLSGQADYTSLPVTNWWSEKFPQPLP